MPSFSDYIKSLLFGDPFGAVYPPRPAPQPPSVDGRTVALRIFRRYVSELTFFRSAGQGANPTPFQIAEKDISIEVPDPVKDLVFPSIAILPGPVTYEVIGLTSYVEESTRDKYAPGTVLQWMSEYNETFKLEVWTSTRAERRAILAGLEAALSPTEQMYGLRFRMPDYYNELVCFALFARNLDDSFAAQRRRRATLEIEMRFNIVSLVNYTGFAAEVTTDVEDWPNAFVEPTSGVDDRTAFGLDLPTQDPGDLNPAKPDPPP